MRSFKFWASGVCFGALVLFGLTLHAQTFEQAASYMSQADEDMTIRKMAALPVSDNTNGIYSRQLERQIIDLIKISHQWEQVESGVAGAMPSVTELEESPSQLQAITQNIPADAFIATALTKGPSGISIRMNLFLKKDGKLLAQEMLRDHPRFEIAEIREQVEILYKKLIAKIPYQGMILSRQANRVTLNLGRSDGVVKDQIITAIQIISVNRHPKFNFLVSTDKEILGRVKILKVDDTLSFGAIVSEKEKGAIRRLAKISKLDPVTYPEPRSLEKELDPTEVLNREDSAISFGKDPKEWVPIRPPSFGQIGLSLGVGTYSTNVNISNVGTMEASASFYPSIGIHGEIWLNPEWTVRADLSQGIIATENPREDSEPTKLNQAVSQYSMAVVYNLLLKDDFFGPKLQVSGGFSSYQMLVDATNPDVFMNTTFSGFVVGIGGSFPLPELKEWSLGGHLQAYIQPSLVEGPRQSAETTKPYINAFSIFTEKKIAENIRARGSLDFSLYGATMSGSGNRDGEFGLESATSLSQRHSVFNLGVAYMF